MGVAIAHAENIDTARTKAVRAANTVKVVEA
jgi:formate-dependent phosphoribosylglycinamide formyltransferase (GAR transformylase)